MHASGLLTVSMGGQLFGSDLSDWKLHHHQSPTSVPQAVVLRARLGYRAMQDQRSSTREAQEFRRKIQCWAARLWKHSPGRRRLNWSHALASNRHAMHQNAGSYQLVMSTKIETIGNSPSLAAWTHVMPLAGRQAGGQPVGAGTIRTV